ncbi:MAG: type II toxin-antitoxin system RelE/ParE family toxin [Fibrobacter sp.]|uniref:type II toxin-antitoxin system RelE/ParE family toxin n=1 Tax=Fibrobacter sp. TaxID=35828 RepID=UPI001B180803|nr:type II toxin-antitoxin system RelE/ParE family toxin [Fibrobacter sp.]MBO7060295.1 type II toxin-antitoxin system RelE/ParE family toxin [Fibrobacter sp.]MBO7106179.1 type II toxin-antitoxin system RelE/ParE family toxin [Fibrobacter sp.]
MIVNQTPEFQKWMQKLRDFRAKAHVLSRLTQVEGGNLGDFKSVGNGVLEMRINYGPGYRLYFAKDGETIVILLIGGDKSSQDQDIVKAKNIWQGIKNEKK